MYQPDMSSLMGPISHLDVNELKEILNDDSKFENLLKDCSQCKDLNAEKEMVIASNCSLAEYNLSKEPALNEGREKVQELSERGQLLYQSIEDKINTLKTSSGSMSLDTAYDLLQASAAEIEEESEEIADNFLTGKIDIDQFLEQFVTRRKLMHLRKVKVDKMKELMSRKAPNNPTMPNYINNTNYFPAVMPSVPYPVGPINMPMPGPYKPNHF